MPKIAKPKKVIEQTVAVLPAEEPKPKAQVKVNDVPVPSTGKMDVDELKDRLRGRKEISLGDRIADSRKVLDFPIPPGQQVFETHDGEIILGEKEQPQIWCERLNGGKGAWVLPRR